MAYFPTDNTPKMYQYTGFFTCRHNLALIAVGGVGLTALVVGILALLHSYQILDVGALGKIPAPGMYALLGGGGGLLLADLIALIVFTIKHKQVKFTECVIYPENAPSFSYTHLGRDVHVKIIGQSREIHQFPTEEAALEYTYTLDSRNYDLYSLLAMKTEANVYTHGKDSLQEFRLHEFIKKSAHECDAARRLLKEMAQDHKVYAFHTMHESEEEKELISIFLHSEGNREIHIFMDQEAAAVFATELGIRNS